MGCQITWHPTRVVVAGIVYRHVRVHAKRARTHNRVQTHTMSPATYRSCSAVPWLVVATHPPNYGDPTRDKHPRLAKSAAPRRTERQKSTHSGCGRLLWEASPQSMDHVAVRN